MNNTIEDIRERLIKAVTLFSEDDVFITQKKEHSSYTLGNDVSKGFAKDIECLLNEIDKQWLSVDLFENSYIECYCWIYYKRKVIKSFYANSRFNFVGGDTGCYMTECITAVMPITKPTPPNSDKDKL